MVAFRTRQDRLFDVVNAGLLGIVLLLTAYPVYFVVIASVSNPTLVSAGQVTILPRGLNFEAYKFIARDERILNGYLNSILYAAGQTAMSLVLTIPAAYALSRREMKGRNLVMALMVFTMYFSGGMIPFYILIRRLGLIDSRLSLMLPNAVNVFNIIIARTFFSQNIADELWESAQMDGCTNTRFFLRIALPLSRAILAIIVLFNVVQSWNAFFNALLFMNTKSKYPLQLVLRQVLLMGGSLTSSDAASYLSPEEIARWQFISDLLRYGIIVVAAAPLLILYPFVQKHFVRGIMVGSIKG